MINLEVRVVKDDDEVFPNEHYRMIVHGGFLLTSLNDFVDRDIPHELSEYEDGEYQCMFELEEDDGIYYSTSINVKKIE